MRDPALTSRLWSGRRFPRLLFNGCQLGNRLCGRYHRRLMNDVAQLLSALRRGDLHEGCQRLRLVYQVLRTV
jgi:hypothetical protein